MASLEQDGAHVVQLTTHLATPKGWKAESAQWADLIAHGLPTYVVTHQLQVERGTGKVRRSTTVQRSQQIHVETV